MLKQKELLFNIKDLKHDHNSVKININNFFRKPEMVANNGGWVVWEGELKNNRIWPTSPPTAAQP